MEGVSGLINNLFAFSATEVGYNHIKNNKVCEDSSDFYDDEDMHICVVADGHGSDNYPRTDRGSQMAVDSAIKCTVDFVKASYSMDPEKSIRIEDILHDENKGYPLLLQLAKSILMDWHESVENDYKNNPFNEKELEKVSEKYRKLYLSENESERAIEKAYGCTLILYTVTEKYSFGFQIGDGKCIVVDQNGFFSEPIPWDENCQLNITTSICDNDAIDEFRFFVSDTIPAAVFCGSDGIDDSYTKTEELYALYRSILKIFIDHGSDVGKSEIKEYLPVLTKKGSGDDVSIGLIINPDRTKILASKLEMQSELFTINEKIREKKQQININIEKDNALSSRIRKWLDSGKKTQDSTVEDITRVNDLRETRGELEDELFSLEKKADELLTCIEEVVTDVYQNESLQIDGGEVADSSEIPTDSDKEQIEENHIDKETREEISVIEKLEIVEENKITESECNEKSKSDNIEELFDNGIDDDWKETIN